MTYQIIYSSASSTPMQIDELEDLLEQAQANNSITGITGALVYVDGYFLQVLEGEQEAVEKLFATISKDLRHDAVGILQAAHIPTAAFADWKMAYVSATAAQVASWAGLPLTSNPPEVWANIHHDRTRASTVTSGILSLLVGTPPV